MTISMFELVYPKFTIDKPIRLIELFAGVGSQAMALRNLGAEFEHHKVVEFDRFAIASYNAIHNTNFETMDITKVKGIDLEITNTDRYDYILTYSFPCQDLSVAGNQQGMSRGSGTRSGLLWEVERLLNEVEELPQILLMENVPQVTSESNIADFHLWQRFLENKGYMNYTDTLNAKDYGVAQNRNRTFMVSILGEYHYKFPSPKPLTKTMKDYLEENVEEKYYINNEKAQNLINQLIDGGQLKNNIECADGSINEPKTREIMNCITARYDCGISNQKSIGGVVIEPLLVMDYRYDEGCRVQDNGDISPTITATETGVHRIESPYRIRKLTPLECWRLMGFTDEDFYKAEKVNSNSQLYKQAGNSIVVDVLEGIFKELIK